MTTATKTKRTRRKLRQYLVDEKGRRLGIVLSIKEYEDLVEAAEQLDDIRYLEEAEAEQGEPIPWEQVKEELRAEGKLP